MHNSFVVSLCKHGIIGGCLQIEPKRLIYWSTKLQLSPELRHIEIPTDEIIRVETGHFLGLPAVSFFIKEEEYKFIVYFQKRFRKTLQDIAGIEI